jgi:hypothetical protein
MVIVRLEAWWRKVLRRDQAPAEPPAAADGAGEAGGAGLLGWGVVANVVDEHLSGEDLQLRHGLKHFAAGAKVWVSAVWNGDGGARRWVVGRHRGSPRYIRIIIEARHLNNARVKPVYSPGLLRLLESAGGRMVFESRPAAEEIAVWLNEPRLEASLDAPPWFAQVGDPPPMQLEAGGTTFYLAHFNHRRARYSHQPPPVEP